MTHELEVLETPTTALFISKGLIPLEFHNRPFSGPPILHYISPEK